MKHETKKIYILLKTHHSLSYQSTKKSISINQILQLSFSFCVKSKENVQNSYAAACSRN